MTVRSYHPTTPELARGASPQKIMESIRVAAEMRAGGAYAHSTLALHGLSQEGHGSSGQETRSTTHARTNM